MQPRGRLIIAIVSNVLEVCAIVLLGVYVLPRWGIGIPPWGLAIIVTGWVAVSVLVYRSGSRALGRKAMAGLPDLTGVKGVVVKDIAPEGVVRIRGELWRATSCEPLSTGQEVVVVSQKGMLVEVHGLV